MAKKCLAMLLCVAMVLSLFTLPAVSAAEGDLFSDDFENRGDVGTKIPEGGGTNWDANYGPVVVGTDPLNPGNKVAEYVASEGQQYPPLQKKVAMAVGTTTLFSGRVLLHDSAVAKPSFYLEYRNSAQDVQANRKTLINLTTSKIEFMGDRTTSYGSAVADKWIEYKLYVTPGLEGENTKILVVLTSADGTGLKNKDGVLTDSISLESEAVLDNIAIFTNKMGKMVHNTNIPYKADDNSARVYLDDVRIYNTASLSSDATLSSLSYNGTPIAEFDPARTTYNVRLETDVESVSLTAVKNDPAAQEPVYSTDALTEFPGSIVVTVTAESGVTKSYTVFFTRKASGDEMAADIMQTKGNVGAIATIISDDGVISSGEILDELTQKYEIPVSCAGIVSQSFNGGNLAKWQEIESHGWIEMINHSWTHPDRMSDSAEHADKECNTEAGLKRELVDSKQYFEENFTTDAISFAAPNNSMSKRGWEIMKQEGYYSARLGERGFNSVSPADGTAKGQWMNLAMQGIGDNGAGTKERNAWVDTVVKNGQWLVEMWHNVGSGGYQPISKADAAAHMEYMVEQRAAGKLWIAGIVEATKYIREAQVSTATAVKTADGKVQAEVSYPDGQLPGEIFDYPLTVKVEVPDTWGAATITQNGVTSTATTFTEGNVNYVYADIVPNQGAAVLEDAGASNLLSDIKLNGVSLSGFNPAQNTYEIEKQSSELPVEITAVALNSKVNVEISQATVTEVPTTVTITLSGDSIDTNVYTLNFIYARSTNNLLSGITVNGKAISNFAAEETAYSVTTEGVEESATVVATAADAKTTVRYSPSATIALPGQVKITVTAENESTKTYTVDIKSRGDDVEYLFDSYDTYTENKQITTGKWNGFNFSADTTTYGVLAVKDPTDDSNMVGKMFNTGASGQNQQMNKQLGATTTEPVIISGRIMIPADTVGSGSYMDVLVRGEGINLTTIANFKDDSSIMVGNSRVANAKFAADKWLSYVLVVKPGSGKYSVTGYFFGEGIMDADGGPVEDGYIVVTQDSASNSLTDMSKLDCRILVRGMVAMGDSNAVYVDDIRIYSPGLFKLSMDNTEGVDTNEGINVNVNHDMAVETLTPAGIVVKDSSNNPVEVSKVTLVDAEKTRNLHIEFASLPANGAYTLTFADTVKDVIGQTVSNTVSFTIQNTDYDAITALAINTPANLSQAYDNMQAVEFSVATTPAENVNPRSVEWYVNNEKQSGTGFTFTYTPAEDGKTYDVYAKVAGADIKSETRTITVTEHPIVPITALALSTPANINQNVGSVTAVTFTAATTPADHVDVSTIEWYLNDEKQPATGASFSFTPADAIGTYTVKAKVAGTEVTSDTKMVTVSLRTPEADVLYLDEWVDPGKYKVGDKVGTGGVGAKQFTMASGSVIVDPKNKDNLAMNIKGSFAQYRCDFPTEGDEVYFSGDCMIQDLATAYDISVRSSKVKTFFKIGKSGDGVRVSLIGKVINDFAIEQGEWVHFTIRLKVNRDDPAKSTIKLYLTGGEDGHNYYESEEQTYDLTGGIENSPYVMYRGPGDYSALLDTQLPLFDNMKVYTTTDFLLSMDKNSDIPVDAPVSVSLNHDIAISTLKKENITVQDASGTPVEISAVSYNALDPSRVTISFANALEANKTYTILFGENVKDVAGNSAANVVAFTTAGGGVTPPDPDVPSYEVAFAAIGAGTIGYTGPDGSAELGAGSTKTLAQGSAVTAVANPTGNAKFMYWVRMDTGRIVSEQAVYSFAVGSATQLTAVFGNMEGQMLAAFKNGRNGQIIQSGYTDGAVIVPDTPFVMGYTFSGWLRDGVPQKFATGDRVELSKDTVFVAGYVKDSKTYEVTVVNGSGSGAYRYNDVVIAVADAAAAGQKFSHWTKNGAVVSFDETYTFYAAGDATVTAVYVEEGAAVTRTPILVASAEAIENGRLAFFAERDLPETWEIVETGLLLSQGMEFDLDSAGVIKTAALSTEAKGQSTVRKAGVSAGEVWFGRAYVVYKEDGKVKVKYSEVVSASL